MGELDKVVVVAVDDQSGLDEVKAAVFGGYVEFDSSLDHQVAMRQCAGQYRRVVAVYKEVGGLGFEGKGSVRDVVAVGVRFTYPAPGVV